MTAAAVKPQNNPQFFQVKVDDSSGNAINIAPAVSNMVVKIWRYDLYVAGGADLQFLSGAATDISGKLGFQNSATASITKDGPGVLPWYTSANGESLDIKASSAVRVEGIVTYSYDYP